MEIIEKAFLQMEQVFENAPEVLEQFLQHDKEDLIEYHFSLGLWIRNEILRPNLQLYNILRKRGISHEDDMSGYLIKEFHEYMSNKQ